MINKVNKLLIAKDVDTSSIADGASMATIVAGIAEGEILLLNKDKTNWDNAGTYVEGSNTDTVYIAVASGETFDYTTETGTAVTGGRKLIMSDPIEGKNVISYRGDAYTVNAEQISDFTAGFTPVVDTEYLVRITYKDIHEWPTRVSQTYRYIALTATLADLLDGLAAVINADGGRRVNATEDDTSLILTGRPIPECTSGLKDIDKFSMVEFDAYFNYVDSAGLWAATGATLATTAAVYGTGNWEQIRDIEKDQFASKGITNRTLFPVSYPTEATVKGGFYSIATIEHNKSYVAPNNQGNEVARVMTQIAYAVASDGDNVNTAHNLFETDLNTWMASCPGNFAAVALVVAGT